MAQIDVIKTVAILQLEGGKKILISFLFFSSKDPQNRSRELSAGHHVFHLWL